MRLSHFLSMGVSVSLLSIGAAFAANPHADSYPTYQDDILTIPRVDTPDQAGNYLDARFKQVTQDLWELQDYKTANEYPLEKAPIEQVKLVIIGTFPVQVFLNIQGTFNHGCGHLRPINHRRVDNRFEVTVQAEFPDLPPGSYACTASLEPFEENIPLPVYGLNAGDYEYSVNGGVYTGKFTLSTDNRFESTGPDLLPVAGPGQ